MEYAPVEVEMKDLGDGKASEEKKPVPVPEEPAIPLANAVTIQEDLPTSSR
jgi:hypothetical protein